MRRNWTLGSLGQHKKESIISHVSEFWIIIIMECTSWIQWLCKIFRSTDWQKLNLEASYWSYCFEDYQNCRYNCQAEAPCTFKYSSSNLPFADISLHALRCTCLGPGISMWFKIDSHSAKSCTPPNFLFQPKISCNLFLLLPKSYLLICSTLRWSAP